MCDYSLESISRTDARQGETYTLKTHGYAGSKGFAPPATEDCAACVTENTVLRIDVPEDLQYAFAVTASESVSFVKIEGPDSYDNNFSYGYKDGVRFDNGTRAKLQRFPAGTRATVLMLADAKAPEDHDLASPALPPEIPGAVESISELIG